MDAEHGCGYVLVTPARNEEAFIERTIVSVVSQTVPPRKWVIVSDGSTDATDAIVSRYASQYPFIRLIRRESGANRNFGSKIMAFNAGYAALKDTTYDLIGNLDADVSFEPRYYETMLEKFSQNPGLGLAGGEIYEYYDGREYAYNSSPWHVSGAIQLFRREAFEDIGGYRAIEKGCVDALACIMVPMRGWKVEKYPEIKVTHYRRQGSAKGVLSTRYHYGALERSLGYHPLYEALKCARRLRERPYVLGSLSHLSGYIIAGIRNGPYLVGDEVREYLRKEHLQRIKQRIAQVTGSIMRLRGPAGL
ncbi:MAG: glycosyltransferase family 2 protein [Desulfomonilia bacterium]|jgi:biofilm PGA synthesis N-glycosyltransferase PgaC